MTSSGKRSRTPFSTQEQGKRVRTDSQGEPSSSSALSTVEPVRETISLPVPSILCKSVSDTLKILKQLFEKDDDHSSIEYPIIIGSRAANFWLPSFRPFSDWDLIATPRQAHDMVKDLEVYEKSHKNPLSISLIRQPLNPKVVKRRPMTPEIEEKVKSLPVCLYKVCGEIKGVMAFEIEIAPVTSQIDYSSSSSGSSKSKKKGKKNKNNEVLSSSSSAGQLLSMCNSSANRALLNFPISASNPHQCLVASIDILETLKSSHINWPAYFHKHIADLHSLRSLIQVNTASSANIGIFADKSKPLTSPERTPELEDVLLTRTIETEAFRGTPGAHINLNVSNEDFLGRDDDLFVTRHIPHDDVHDLVKYGSSPIYDQLKTDSAKAMVSRALFEAAPYDTQIKCVKEETMVIALERYLLPSLSSDPSSAYKSALIRICTTLTKGWFRQFAVDNYPRLSICDKHLLPIRDEILAKHPLPPKVRNDPLDILKATIESLDDLATVQPLISLTKPTSIERVKRLLPYDAPSDSEDSDDDSYHERRRGDEYHTDQGFWIIRPTSQDQGPLFISFINESYHNYEDCNPSFRFYSTLSVQPINRNTKFNSLRAYDWDSENYYMNQTLDGTIHKVATTISAETSGGSWGGEDIWSRPDLFSNNLADAVQTLNMEGLTEDLLMKFILAVVQPKLHNNGETPLRNGINAAKMSGRIPVSSQNHLWFDLWKHSHLF